MRAIKVWGGTHPDEALPLAVACSLIDDPIPGVEAGIVNILAEQMGQRFVNINMNRGYPGDRFGYDYEERRAVEVIEQSRQAPLDGRGEGDPYYMIVDMHSNSGIGEDAACIGSRGVRPEILGFFKKLGLTKLVLTTHSSLPEYIDNCYGFEITEGGPRSSVEYWRKMFTNFVVAEELPRANVAEFEWFRHTGGVHESVHDPIEIPKFTEGFSRVEATLEAVVGYDGPQHWLTRMEAPNQAGYWAELCTPIDPPDDTHWPN